MNRCLNDIFAYCTGTPEVITEKVSVPHRDFGGINKTDDQLWTFCKLDTLTCGSHLSHTELNASTVR